jgi:type II restriction enzyme
MRLSTPDLRDEIRHSFWLLKRVASAKALERLLKQHEVFKDYTIVLAAGDGRTENDTDSVPAAGKACMGVAGWVDRRWC